METDLYICVETATGKLVAIEIEPRQYVRADDPYFRRGVAAYINETFPPLGTVLSQEQLASWAEYKTKANDRDTLYKMDGPQISTSAFIGGFQAK